MHSRFTSIACPMSGQIYACVQGMLELADIKRRVAQFVAAGLPVVVTTACLLVDKARLLPHSTFVVSVAG